jgi:spore germination cell wall hydrolase CwlJ-like protein
MIFTDQVKAAFFLALLIWRESRGEGAQGMTAVGCSVRDRVRNPGWWGNDYLSVIEKKWQYSSLTNPKDGQLTAFPPQGDPQFDFALDSAIGIIGGWVRHPVAGADSYYDDSIPPPEWATPDKLVGKIGRLNFYNIDGKTED